MDFIRQRNDDIMRAYRQQLRQASYVVMPEIFQKVADSPSCRFWVSEERAAVVVARLLAGKPLSCVHDNKREMFREIYRRFLLLREQFPRKSDLELVTIVVNQPAPKFYLTARTVGEFVYRIRNGWYDRKHKRHRHHSE